MLIATINRVELAQILPSSNTIAEIGVFRGGFASVISKRINPSKFHLIDPWGKDSEDEYVTSYSVSDDMEKMFQSVVEMFRNKIESGHIEVHRDYSTRVAANFPNRYFDWINIDGMHSYDAVLSDLRCFSEKIKDDGFIMGHDFSNTRMGRFKKFGVIRAVTEFCQSEGWRIVLVTNEDAPSYLIIRQNNNNKADLVLESVASLTNAHIFEIDESLLRFFEQVEFPHQGGKRKQIFRFGPLSITSQVQLS